jgi:hypothetical protein
VGSAVDYSVSSSQKNVLQNAADAGALAGARELTLAGPDQSHAIEIAKVIARNNIKGAPESVVISAAVIGNRTSVSVDITQPTESFFSRIVTGGANELHVNAVATAASAGQKICVLGLDEDDGNTISLDASARLTADDCAVFSNSKSSVGLKAQGSSLMRARLICSAGGKVGGRNNFSPEPLTDCPMVKDPLASRPAPAVGPCNLVNWLVKDVVRTLWPGVYCGGLRIDGHAKVRLMPGIYVMKNGPLIVDSNAELEGEYVGFYFTGANALFRFTSNAKVTLGAPKTGNMAGILFYEDRANPENRKFEITSNYTRKLLGTIYLPKARFIIDANQPVADQSAYTAIVVRKLELNSGPNLVINSNYESTDVPVPEGIGPATGQTRLIQ